MKKIVAIFDRGMEQDHPDAVDLLQSTLQLLVTDYCAMEHPVPPGVISEDDLVVLCGKKVAESFTNEKIAITKRAGHVVMSSFEDVKATAILQLSPAYIIQQERLKGGEAEKMGRLWTDVWEKIVQMAGGVGQSAPEVTHYENEEEVVGLLEWILSANLDVLAYDYETWGDVSALRPELCTDFKVVSIGVAWREEDGSIANGSFLYDRPLRASKKLEGLWKRVLREVPLVAHYSRYEHKVNMRRFGFTRPCRDTILQLHALDELADGSLERLMVRCGLFWSEFKEINEDTRKNPLHAETRALLTYNGLDAHATLECYYIQEDELAKEGLSHIARQDEQFNVDQSKQEMFGMFIDVEAVSEELKKAGRDTTELLAEFRNTPEVKRTEKWAKNNIKRYAKVEAKDVVFNPKSTPMLQHFLLKSLKIPAKDVTVKEKGKTKISGKKDILGKLSVQYPILAKLNDYRSAAAMTTMLDKWDSFIGPDGCVHSQYSQTTVVTGRISSTNPPLQNIPKDNSVRKIFTSRFGDEGILISSDFKQQEPRLIAGWSGEEKMISAILSGMDLHAFVGAEIFGEDYEEVVARHNAGEKVKSREVGKRMNLGIVYGQTEFGLSAKTGMSIDEARVMLRQYDERFPGVSKWMMQFHQQAIEYGFVSDLFGARRHLPGAQSTDKWVRARALRQAGNYPVQATAYRFTQISAGVTQELFEQELPGEAMVVGQVHDSLVVDGKKKHLPTILAIIQEGMLIHNMMSYWKFKGMPMDTDVSIGPNLHDMKLVRTRG